MDELLDGMTMEQTFIEVVKERTKAFLDSQYVDVLDCLNIINLEVSPSATDELKRLRKVYDLILEKREALKERPED